MDSPKPLVIEKTLIGRIIDEDISLTRLVYAYIASTAVWLRHGALRGLHRSY